MSSLPLIDPDPRRVPLLLAPDSSAGWFTGSTVLAMDPESDVEHEPGGGLQAAGAALDAAMAGKVPLVAVVLDYTGRARVLSYGGGLTWTGETWDPFGPRPPKPPRAGSKLPPHCGPLMLEPSGDMDQEAFEDGVADVRRTISQGDVYVLNLTYRLSGGPAMPAWPLFAEMFRRGAGKMSAVLLDPERSWLSISPERFISIEGGIIGVEPIKGTAPRGEDRQSDEALASALAADAKERAEHVMIVDMERNDLGRVSVPGTVRVDPFLDVIATPYCHQMVSVVRGMLRDDIGMDEVLAATFPCGSVTGAPKVSAMSHIERLERSVRGAYCGSLLVAMEDRLDSSVLIRTAQLSGETMAYGTGGGITWDSDPRSEWLETLTKASPVIGVAPRRS